MILDSRGVSVNPEDLLVRTLPKGEESKDLVAGDDPDVAPKYLNLPDLYQFVI